VRIPYRERWLLRGVDRRLCRSDPHLATMLAIFARLNAGEAITGQEQATSPGARTRRGLAWLAETLAHLAAVLVACAGRTSRHAAGACAAVWRWLSRVARAAAGAPSPACPPMRRDDPGLPAS
jgi:hypothetical protein